MSSEHVSRPPYDVRPTAEEIVAALHQTTSVSGRGRGGGGGGGGGGGFLHLCCDEGADEEDIIGDGDVNLAAGRGGGGFYFGGVNNNNNGGGGGGGNGNNAAFSLSRLKTLGRRVVQTVQYAFFGMVLRPGWFITSMGGGGGGGGGGEGEDGDGGGGGDLAREYSTTWA